jgi:hypothetical protein
MKGQERPDEVLLVIVLFWTSSIRRDDIASDTQGGRCSARPPGRGTGRHGLRRHGRPSARDCAPGRGARAREGRARDAQEGPETQAGRIRDGCPQDTYGYQDGSALDQTSLSATARTVTRSDTWSRTRRWSSKPATSSTTTTRSPAPTRRYGRRSRTTPSASRSPASAGTSSGWVGGTCYRSGRDSRTNSNGSGGCYATGTRMARAGAPRRQGARGPELRGGSHRAADSAGRRLALLPGGEREGFCLQLNPSSSGRPPNSVRRRKHGHPWFWSQAEPHK